MKFAVMIPISVLCFITVMPAYKTAFRENYASTAVFEPSDAPMIIDGILLVNKTYGLPKNYGKTEDAEALAALSEMRAAAQKDGIKLFVISGYRSYERQKALYESYVAKDGEEKADTYSAKPGHSEHQTGLAFDLNSCSDSFADTPEAKWIEQNCRFYGFIVRYPRGKEVITGYKYEPWHIRYVGTAAAEAICSDNLCLEEYLLKN